MKTFEIQVCAAYKSAGTKYSNCFKEYREADTPAEAKRNLKEELKKDGYMNIQMEVMEVRA